VDANLARKTDALVDATPVPRRRAGELAPRGLSGRAGRVGSRASRLDLADAASAAIVIGAFVSLAVLFNPGLPRAVLTQAGGDRVAPADGVATHPASPTSLLFGVEDIAFQNQLEMSLLETR
jgi:hypothetical protein